MSKKPESGDLNVKGETRVDYFHFICGKCGEDLMARLGTDGAVRTITTDCKCGQRGTLKLYRTS
ncbi:hypothetical protein BH23GEM1_BH23GEM1_00580 [soil metagenome]